MNEPLDPLDRLLDRWAGAEPDVTGLGEDVWRRIGRLEKPEAGAGLLARLETRFARPAFALLFLTACILGALVLIERRTALRQGAVNEQLARQYLRLIDPLRDAPSPAGSLDIELAWLRDELQLSPAQFARIRQFHESSGPELRAGDSVDFLAVARLDETRRTIDRACLDSTHRLLQEAAMVMTPEQRRRYLQYVQDALFTGTRSNSY